MAKAHRNLKEYTREVTRTETVTEAEVVMTMTQDEAVAVQAVLGSMACSNSHQGRGPETTGVYNALTNALPCAVRRSIRIESRTNEHAVHLKWYP